MLEILHEAGTFTGTFQPLDIQKGLDDQGRLISPDEAYRIKKEVSGQPGKILEAHKGEKEKESAITALPVLFTKSSIVKAWHGSKTSA